VIKAVGTALQLTDWPIVGVMCPGIFAGLCWFAKLAFCRELARLDSLATEQKQPHIV